MIFIGEPVAWLDDEDDDPAEPLLADEEDPDDPHALATTTTIPSRDNQITRRHPDLPLRSPALDLATMRMHLPDHDGPVR
jgi:hypothetical protein